MDSPSIRSRCKMSVARDIQIVMQILDRAHMGQHYLPFTHSRVGRPRSTACTVASLSGNDIRTQSCITRTHVHDRHVNHGLHAVRPRTCKQKPRGNHSDDYGERRRAVKRQKPLTEVLTAKNHVDNCARNGWLFANFHG